MLGKLIRYEMPALGRKLLPLYAAWAATSVVLGLSVGQVSSKTETPMVFSGVLYGGIATAVLVMAVVMIVQRFRNSLLGDEGYFMHALPVSASQHIAGKTISAVLWVMLSLVAFLVTGLLIVIFSGQIREVFSPDFLKNFFYVFTNLRLEGVLSLLELIVAWIVSLAKSILAIYTALAIGYQAEKRQGLVSILAYVGVLTVESTITTTIVSHIFPHIFGVSEFSQPDFNLLVLFAIIGAGVFGAVYFFICKYMLEKRLNLA